VVRAITVATALVLITTAIFMTATWRNGDVYELYVRRSAQVLRDGKELPGAEVFKGSKGHILVTFPSHRSAPYIYLPESKDVGECNPNTFVSLGAFGLQKHTRDGRYPCGGSTKQEIQQDLTNSDTALAFNIWELEKRSVLQRIEIRW